LNFINVVKDIGIAVTYKHPPEEWTLIMVDLLLITVSCVDCLVAIHPILFFLLSFLSPCFSRVSLLRAAWLMM